MVVKNVSNETIWLALPPTRGLVPVRPDETFTVVYVDDHVLEMVATGKLVEIADMDIEDYTFNVDEPDAEEIDTPDISDTFNNIRFKE